MGNILMWNLIYAVSVVILIATLVVVAVAWVRSCKQTNREQRETSVRVNRS